MGGMERHCLGREGGGGGPRPPPPPANYDSAVIHVAFHYYSYICMLKA